MSTGIYLLLQLMRISGQLQCRAMFRIDSAKHTKTPRYQAKKKIVRGLWIACGAMMIAFPITHFVITLGLFTTFLSFTILDESL